jgi:ABC-type uncharacterized transport system auxiliary subunit
MQRTVQLTLTSILALSVWGCGSSKPIKYYTVQMTTAPTLSNGRGPVSLLIGHISGSQVFKDTPIAYRSGANEIGVYQYSQWYEPPVDLIKGKLIRILRVSGNYQSVNEVGSTSDGQFVVRGRLYDFEEVDNGSISGLVSMEFDLYDRKTGKVVWTHFYSQSEPVTSKEIPAIVAALDNNLDRGLKEVAAGLDQYFATNPPGKS